jgi:hypothetical protein
MCKFVCLVSLPFSISLFFPFRLLYLFSHPCSRIKYYFISLFIFNPIVRFFFTFSMFLPPPLHAYKFWLIYFYHIPVHISFLSTPRLPHFSFLLLSFLLLSSQLLSSLLLTAPLLFPNSSFSYYVLVD